MGIQMNYGSDQAPEYNTPNADSSNGATGTNTYGAQINRSAQPGRPPTGNDPYQNFKNSARQWGMDMPLRPRDKSLDPQQPGAATTPPGATDLWNQWKANPTNPNAIPASPAYKAAALASTLQGNTLPAAVDAGSLGGSTGGRPTGAGYAPDAAPASPPPPHLVKGNTDPNQPAPPPNMQQGQQTPPKPAGVDDQTWADAQRYVADGAAKGADYSYLLQHPELITQFRNAFPDGSVDIVDWLKGQGYASALAGRNGGVDTYQAYLQTHGTPTTPGQPPTPPALPQAPTPPPAPDTTTNTVDPTKWNDVHMPQVPDDQALMGMLQKGYSPVYQQGQQDLQKILQGQQALTGDSNSAAASEVIGQQEGRLIGQQNADLTDKFQAAREAEKNRALQQYQTDVGAGTAKYGIDTNKFVQLVNNDTQRLGIKTNAQLQTYLGQIQAYGIDTDALMKEYTAQLALTGQKYSVDGQVNMNALNAAMQKYGIDQNAQNNFTNANVNKYGIDKNAQIQMIHDLVSEGVIDAQTAAQILAGTPGYAYQPAGGG